MIGIFETAGMMAHGYCLLWQPGLVALHAASDVLILVSYFLIPVAILALMRRRPDVRLHGIAALFASFIMLCGLSHLLGLVTLWMPIYEIQGVVKLATGLISAVTAAVLFPLIPKIAALPSPARLQAEIDSHRATLAELTRIRDGLEVEVAERTRDLSTANQRLTLVSREAVHRSANLLNLVQAIARQSARFAPSKTALVDALADRMTAIGRALSAAIEDGNANAALGGVVAAQLTHLQASFPGRIGVAGPHLVVRPEAAQLLGLAVHELATNAVKHGALARDEGRVDLAWQIGDDGRLRLTWREELPASAAAAPAADSVGQGFGRLLLTQAVPAQLGAELEHGMTATGYRYDLLIPLEAVRAAAPGAATLPDPAAPDPSLSLA